MANRARFSSAESSEIIERVRAGYARPNAFRTAFRLFIFCARLFPFGFDETDAAGVNRHEAGTPETTSMLPPPTDGIALGMIRVHSTRPNSLSTHIAQKHPRPPRTNLSPKLKKSSSSTKRTK